MTLVQKTSESPERTRFLRLRIENFGLIESTEIEFSSGFTVFSGETGSGKTMVLGAVALVLGERIVGSVVRRGAERARLTLEFFPDAMIRERCDMLGFPLDPGEDGIVLREITANGRSSIRMNGRPATAAQLREIMAGVVELVGQHEQQRLLSPNEHVHMLDRFGGLEIVPLRATVRHWAERVAQCAAELTQINTEREREAYEHSAAQAQLEDIAAVHPQLDEDRLLRERRDRLQDRERIFGAVQCAHEALAGDERSASIRLSEAIGALRTIERHGAEYAALSRELENLQHATHDVITSLTHIAASLAESDIGEMETLLERLEQIERLKRRYGGSIESIKAQELEARAILDQSATRDDRFKQAQQHFAETETQLYQAAEALSAARRNAARHLEETICRELHALAMPEAQFVVQFERCAEIGINGAERVTFLLAANRGSEPMGLAQCASGGELSRILLACILVLASDAAIAAVVFDEIDAGIGGATGLVLGERLARLARQSQVLCVTHLAQIACFADVHLVVQKASGQEMTQVALHRMQTQQERVAEIARMLSGKTSDAARKHAAQLLKNAMQ